MLTRQQMVQQMAIYDQGCKLMVGTPPFCPNKRANLSRQDSGRDVLRSERQWSDTKL